MGGYGSGRSGGKPKAEGHKRIDVRYLHGRGMLVANCDSTLTWSIDGEPTGNIRLSSYDDKLVLDYRAKAAYENEWTEIKEDVYLDWTPCHFGGKRPWLLCPRCNRRVALIFSIGKRFLCRHCYNITYSSQCETEMDRLLRKAQKIRRQLGVSESLSEPIIFKPKGMHQKTFDRLRHNLYFIEESINTHMYLLFSRLSQGMS
jgi:hypothetical protein